ncbi:hypothetical protein OHR68_43125 [Spirillospora sp. NBC_00431]
MAERTDGPCPPWCDGDHPADVHRAEIGHTTLEAKTLMVVVLQVGDGEPTVTISGGLYIGLHRDDHDDMVELLTICGQPELARLVRRAAEMLAAVMRDERNGR